MHLNALETPCCVLPSAVPTRHHPCEDISHSEDVEIEALDSAGLAAAEGQSLCHSSEESGCSQAGGEAALVSIPALALTREASVLPVSIIFPVILAQSEQPGCKSPWFRPVQPFVIAIGHCHRQTSRSRTTQLSYKINISFKVF